MKMDIKNMLLAVLMLVSGMVSAQNYQIYKVSDNVSVKEKSQVQWVAAEKRMKVTYPDSLKIDNGGSISLLNTSNNQIFVCNKYGKYRVKNAIDESLRDAGNIVAYTTQSLSSAISSKSKTPQYNVYGATMRGRASKETMDVNMQMVASLRKVIASVRNGKNPKQSDKVNLSRVVDEETFHFVINNKDVKPYVVNVLRIPKEGNPNFCINLDKADSEYYFALVDGQSELDAASFTFLSDDATYVLIASEQVYDSSWVEKKLNEKTDTKQKSSLKTELFIIQ